MTLGQYRNAIRKRLQQSLKDEEYVNKLDSDIEMSYNEERKVSKILGSNQLSPDGYCMGIELLYPDLP